MSKWFISLLCLCCIFSGNKGQAAPASLTQTQKKLKQIDVQINQLKQSLAKAKDKHALLDKELSLTEKEMGEGVKRLLTIQDTVAASNLKIKHLEEQVSDLNQRVQNQQHLVSQHIRALYQMGEYQPMKCLINQENTQQLSRILTYYRYILQARKSSIDAMKATSKKLNQGRLTLERELSRHVMLKKELALHQEKLLEKKQYHAALIESLDEDIQNHQQHLQDAQKNKANLASLIKTLNRQSQVKPSKPFAQMRKKLPYPVHTSPAFIKSMNQGVTFFADEGTKVTAVYPGKVVFSDWLKGYGLLLIIDHGQGFMTLYAHNQALFKRKGEFVNQKETIASIGHTGGIRQNGLYFEIRVRGKAVPPLGWLV